MAKWLISRGHSCRVLLHQGKNYGITEIYNLDGVEVFPATRNDIEMNLMAWCSIAITHLEYTGWTIEMCRIYKKPCCQIVHNDTPYDVVLGSYKDLNIIYNSQWIADKLKYRHRGMVLTPPVDWRYYDQGIEDPSKNEFITLINCNENKGGKQFGKIAAAMPDRKFLAVKGSYEEQFIADLPNIHIMDNTADIRPVYRMTRLLLMPSKYESWGMTCSEAMANGIPVICTETAGLLENTAGKMLYCKRNNISEWVKRIKFLDSQKQYEKFSKLGRERSREMDPAAGYEKLEQFLYGATN